MRQRVLPSSYRRREGPLPHLTAALAADPNDVPTRVNRGEVYLRLENYEAARTDLEFVLRQKIANETPLLSQCLTRARALLMTVERFSRPAGA